MVMTKSIGGPRRAVSKVEREATRLLRSSGLPFELKHGSRHIKIYIRGCLALVLSPSGTKERDCKLLNTIIKKHKAETCK